MSAAKLPVDQQPTKTQGAAAREALPVAVLPGYEILDVLGRGGMGIVYKARQASLGRIVALKMIVAGKLAGADDIKRFQAEAEAIAQLKNRYIVQVHDVGEHDGVPYFTMEYIEGGSLHARIGDKPQPARWSAELIEKVASGIQAAHLKGIIHRDLKPANILLSYDGEPKITDFGLAKRVEQAEGLTQSGAQMGTPQYMSPEQARGHTKRVGRSADVYALGVILYQLLTGRPPFLGESIQATLDQVINQDPVPITRLQQRVPRDLETICFKCLRKEGEKRYASAAELAADLRRFINGEPIFARRIGVAERAVKLARRRPAAAGLIVVSVFAAVALAWNAGLLYEERNRALSAETKANNKARDANEARIKSDKLVAQYRLLQGDVFLKEGRHIEAKAQFQDALTRFEQLQSPRFEPDAGFYQYYQLHPRELWTASAGETVRSVTFCSDGARALSVGDHGSIILWDIRSGTQIRRFAEPKVIGNSQTAITSDQKYALTMGEDLARWELDTGKKLMFCEKLYGWSFSLSADNRRILVGGQPGVLTLWDVQSGAKLLTIGLPDGEIPAVAIAPDGRSGVSWSAANREFAVWDLESGRSLNKFKGHDGTVRTIVFDGKKAFSASADNTFAVWDVETGKKLPGYDGASDLMICAAFSPDRKRALSSSFGNAFKLWDADSSKVELRTFRGHARWVRCLAFSPDGRFALSGGEDATLKLWDVAAAPGPQIYEGHDGAVTGAAFSRDGTRIVSSGADATVKLWDAATACEMRTLAVEAGKVLCVDFSADAKFAASGHEDGTVRLWDINTGAARVLSDKQNYVADAKYGAITLAFTPDGSQLITGGWDRVMRLWDARAAVLLKRFDPCAGRVLSVAVSPDGKYATSAAAEHTIQLWNLATGTEVPYAHSELRLFPKAVAFAPDGRSLISGYQDESVRILPLFGSAIRILKGHDQWVNSVQFSPDGRYAATGSSDRMVKLWNVATGDEVRSFSIHDNPVSSVRFASDGRRILSTGHEPGLVCWDLSRAARWRELEFKVAAAQSRLNLKSDDAEALKTLGEWYAFRGVDDWAADLTERAAQAGAQVSPLLLARCYWRLKDFGKARAHFELALAADEADEEYLEECLQAVGGAK